MTRQIDEQDARANFGIVPDHRSMPNGELRFTLRASDGTAYIRTESGKLTGEWQNSHSHKHCRETYIVERGWLAFATLRDDSSAHIVIYTKGSVFTTEPGVAHNIYLPANSVIHTVKHDASGPGKDWNPNKKLDAKTHPLDERSILAFGVGAINRSDERRNGSA